MKAEGLNQRFLSLGTRVGCHTASNDHQAFRLTGSLSPARSGRTGFGFHSSSSFLKSSVGLLPAVRRFPLSLSLPLPASPRAASPFGQSPTRTRPPRAPRPPPPPAPSSAPRPSGACIFDVIASARSMTPPSPLCPQPPHVGLRTDAGNASRHPVAWSSAAAGDSRGGVKTRPGDAFDMFWKWRATPILLHLPGCQTSVVA